MKHAYLTRKVPSGSRQVYSGFDRAERRRQGEHCCVSYKSNTIFQPLLPALEMGLVQLRGAMNRFRQLNGITEMQCIQFLYHQSNEVDYLRKEAVN